VIDPPKPISLKMYSTLLKLAKPAVHMLIARRKARGKEHPERVSERFGDPGLARPNGPLTWVHAASVGETTTMLPLIERIVARGHTVLLTTVTLTSADLAAKRLPKGAIHQFVPVDLEGPVTRFLDHWRPDLAIIAEQEIWPNLIEAVHARGIPLVLSNARMSPKSFANWKRLPAAAERLLSRFSLVLAQSSVDADRLSSLGAQRVVATGNLKFDLAPPAAPQSELLRWRTAFGSRPVFAAASTHPGEDEIVLDAHQAMAKTLPNLLTLIAPRHPARGDAIAALAQARALDCMRRSSGALPTPGTRIFIIDTIGDLGLVYRVSPVAFMGKSLRVGGGQNPIEAVALGCIALHGPDVSNFPEVYDAFDHAGVAIPIADADDMARRALDLMSNPSEHAERIAAGQAVVSSVTGALDRTITALDPWFVEISLRAGRAP
jgi:3-deoxy-D-manno-octulosonic-acid transferase